MLALKGTTNGATTQLLRPARRWRGARARAGARRCSDRFFKLQTGHFALSGRAKATGVGHGMCLLPSLIYWPPGGRAWVAANLSYGPELFARPGWQKSGLLFLGTQTRRGSLRVGNLAGCNVAERAVAPARTHTSAWSTNTLILGGLRRRPTAAQAAASPRRPDTIRGPCCLPARLQARGATVRQRQPRTPNASEPANVAERSAPT